MMEGIPLSQVSIGRKLEDLHANELRLKLENAGIAYPDDAGKQELIALIRKNKL